MDFEPPAPISAEQEREIVNAATAGDPSAVGTYAVAPNEALLERLSFEGDNRQMTLCVPPAGRAHLLGRSMAWYNQRAHVLDRNAPDAEPVTTWSTPRTHNTRLGPEDGIDIELPFFYLLSGRITEDSSIGNRVMIDPSWKPETGGWGCRILCACDKGAPNFHDSCFMISSAA